MENAISSIHNLESTRKNPLDVQMLREQYAMVYKKDVKMVDFCVKAAAAAVVMPHGELIVIEKKHIENRFCFGESGYDYDDALRMAQHARTSVDHFIRENMEHYNSIIERLTESLQEVNGEECYGHNADMVIIHLKPQYDRCPESRLHSWNFARMSDVIDACGGSCHIQDLPGKELTIRSELCRIATAFEIETLIEAYKIVAAAHEKKIAAYLKRYGLSKVRAWTYWLDA